MISLTVTDPTPHDAKILRAIADAIAPQESVSATVDALKPATGGAIPGGTHVIGQTVATIAPADNPAAGAEVLTSEKVDSHGTAALDLDAAKLLAMGADPGPTLGEVDPAMVFAGGAAGAPPLPNVLSPTPTPPPSPQPSSQTSTPPSGAATNASPPPPPAPAPAPANASGAAATTNGVQTDSAGLPWDARIHASTKATIQDGTWKKRRGVAPEEVTAVEAQLRAAMAVPTRLAPEAGWPFPTSNPHADPAGAPTFADLMQFITPRSTAGTLNQAMVTAAVQSVGLDSLNLVMARPDLIPAILTELRKVAP